MTPFLFSNEGDLTINFINGYEVSLHQISSNAFGKANMLVLSLPSSIVENGIIVEYNDKTFSSNGHLFLGQVTPEEFADAVSWAAAQPNF